MNELFLFHPYVAYLIFSLFALTIGSFLNVVIYRLPIMLQKDWTTQCRTLLHLPSVKDKELNLCVPRSHCPHCRSLIPMWHNIPLISFLVLKGRCAQCKMSISWQYPLIELITMSLSLMALLHFGFNLSLLFSLLFIWLMITLTAIDLRHQLLPDSLVLGLLWIGLIANTQTLFTPLPIAVLSAAGAYLGLWLFAKLFQLVRRKVGLGLGDVKLFAAFGAWFGLTYLPLILLISSITGVVFAGVYLYATKQNKETPIPFGPFLCFAGLVTLIYGRVIEAICLTGLTSLS